jgi:hypothetical protein
MKERVSKGRHRIWLGVIYSGGLCVNDSPCDGSGLKSVRVSGSTKNDVVRESSKRSEWQSSDACDVLIPVDQRLENVVDG